MAALGWRGQPLGTVRLAGRRTARCVLRLPSDPHLVRSVSEFTPPEAGGLDNFAWFFDSGTNVTILIRTLKTAFLVTALCLLVGYPYAYVMTIVGRRVRMVLLAALVIAEFSSLLVRSYAWVILCRPTGRSTMFWPRLA